MTGQQQAADHGDGTPVPALRRLAGLGGCLGVLLLGAVALTQSPPATSRASSPVFAPAGASSPPAAELPAPVRVAPCAMAPAGFVRGRWFGTLDLVVDWTGPELGCEGMLRPHGNGIRLLFAQQLADGSRVVLVLGIDGDPDALPGPERPTNVTIIDEREGRFFSTTGAGRCWTDIQAAGPLQLASASGGDWRVAGILYCVGALPALGDRGSLTLGETRFAGIFSRDAL